MLSRRRRQASQAEWGELPGLQQWGWRYFPWGGFFEVSGGRVGKFVDKSTFFVEKHRNLSSGKWRRYVEKSMTYDQKKTGNAGKLTDNACRLNENARTLIEKACRLTKNACKLTKNVGILTNNIRNLTYNARRLTDNALKLTECEPGRGRQQGGGLTAGGRRHFSRKMLNFGLPEKYTTERFEQKCGESKIHHSTSPHSPPLPQTGDPDMLAIN